jgi:hypothetical protein
MIYFTDYIRLHFSPPIVCLLSCTIISIPNFTHFHHRNPFQGQRIIEIEPGIQPIGYITSSYAAKLQSFKHTQLTAWDLNGNIAKTRVNPAALVNHLISQKGHKGPKWPKLNYTSKFGSCQQGRLQ